MGAAIDMIGRRYGKLTVVGHAENRNNIRYWRCRCDCGAEILTQGGPLRKGSKTCWGGPDTGTAAEFGTGFYAIAAIR